MNFDTSSVNLSATIEDFHEGVQYNINNHYGACSVIPINAYSLNAVLGPNGTYHLQGVKIHLLRRDEYNYTYDGFSVIRGVDTESWISVHDNIPFGNLSNFTGYF